MGAPWLNQRARRAEVRDQLERERQASEEQKREQAFEQRRALYAALNSAARDYRSALRHTTWAIRRGQSPDENLREVKAMREVYQRYYSQVQMVMPRETLEVVESVNQSLGRGQRLVLGLTENGTWPNREELEKIHKWISGPLPDAVQLLRRALRADLGVDEPISNLQECLEKLAVDREDGDFRSSMSGQIGPHAGLRVKTDDPIRARLMDIRRTVLRWK